jgi:hypothetical protein
MKRFLKIILSIAVFWGALTIFVEMPGPSREKIFMAGDSHLSAVILYDADPFYNLDEQVCIAFAESLVESGYSVKVMTVKAARRQKSQEYNLYVFCANTYNWAPDWAMKKYIGENRHALTGKNVAAMTVGSGATSRSKRMFEDFINGTGANLLGSQTYWLMKPNSASARTDSNVEGAVEMARAFGQKVAKELMSLS